jgi:large subunit ribosomal protein L10
LAISKQQKDELVAEYKDLIARSDALILAQYTGMTVKEMESLRSRVREADGALYVTKNTLLKLALEESGVPAPEELLSGQVATGFAFSDVPALAKVLVNYAGSDEKLSIKGGIMEMRTLSGEQIEALAKLPSLDQLRAQIIGLVSAPARDIVSIIASGVRQVVNVLDAYSKSAESEGEAA